VSELEREAAGAALDSCSGLSEHARWPAPVFWPGPCSDDAVMGPGVSMAHLPCPFTVGLRATCVPAVLFKGPASAPAPACIRPAHQECLDAGWVPEFLLDHAQASHGAKELGMPISPPMDFLHFKVHRHSGARASAANDACSLLASLDAD